MNRHPRIEKLYQAVDSKNLADLSALLADHVHYRIANAAPIQGKAAVLAANATFFRSIHSMSHRIDQVWDQGDALICAGEVTFTRQDRSRHSAVFVTLLRIERDRIVDYRVYIDISGLHPASTQTMKGIPA